MGITYNPKVVTDGLVFCVDAASKRSYPGTGTTWTDLAGSNNGTLTNGPTFSSDNGGSIVFDGSDDYVLLGNDINLGTSASITVWVKDISTGTIAGATSAGDGGLILVMDRVGFTNYVALQLPGSNSASIQWNVGILDIAEEWTHLSISRDALTVYLYVNGVAYLMTTTDTSGTMATIGSRVRRLGGGRYSYAGSPMEGQIACLQLYNRALTADEVRQNYNATRGRFK